MYGLTQELRDASSVRMVKVGPEERKQKFIVNFIGKINLIKDHVSNSSFLGSNKQLVSTLLYEIECNFFKHELC